MNEKKLIKVGLGVWGVTALITLAFWALVIWGIIEAILWLRGN